LSRKEVKGRRGDAKLAPTLDFRFANAKLAWHATEGKAKSQDKRFSYEKKFITASQKT
jgi:hypothetical protein